MLFPAAVYSVGSLLAGLRRVAGEKERDAKKKQLAAILSVSERTVRDWLSRMDKDAKEARNKRIFDLWLAGWTQREIAAAVGIIRKDVERSLGQNGNLSKLSKTQQSAANHATNFNPPIYNIWKQQSKSEGSEHFGNSEVRWLVKAKTTTNRTPTVAYLHVPARSRE